MSRLYKQIETNKQQLSIDAATSQPPNRGPPIVIGHRKDSGFLSSLLDLPQSQQKVASAEAPPSQQQPKDQQKITTTTTDPSPQQLPLQQQALLEGEEPKQKSSEADVSMKRRTMKKGIEKQIMNAFAELKLNEKEIWEGSADLFPLLYQHKDILFSLTAVEANSSSKYPIKFNFPPSNSPSIHEFQGAVAKTFLVNPNREIQQVIASVCKKMHVHNPKRFQLTTLRGYILNSEECLYTYGVGSIFHTWELNLIYNPDFNEEKEDESEAGLVTVLFPSLAEFKGLKSRTFKADKYTIIQKIIDFICKKFGITTPPTSFVLTTQYSDMESSSGSQIMQDFVLNSACDLCSYGFGKRFTMWTLKMTYKELVLNFPQDKIQILSEFRWIQIREAKVSLSDVKNAFISADKKLHLCVKELSDERKLNEEAMASLTALQQRCSKMEEEAAYLRNLYNSMLQQNETLSTQCSAQRTANMNLLIQNNELSETLIAEKNNSIRLQKKLEDVSSQLNSTLKELESITQGKNSRETELLALTREVTERDALIAELERKCSTATSALQQSIAEKHNLLSELNDLKSKLHQQQLSSVEQINPLIQQLEQFKNTLLEKQMVNLNNTQHGELLQSAIDKLSEYDRERNALREQLLELSTSIESKESLLRDQMERHSLLQQQHKQSQQLNDELSASVSILQQECSRQKTEVTKLQDKITSLELSIDSLKKEYDNEKKDLLNRIQSAEEQIKSITDERDKLQRTIINMEKMHEQTVRDLKTQIEILSIPPPPPLPVATAEESSADPVSTDRITGPVLIEKKKALQKVETNLHKKFLVDSTSIAEMIFLSLQHRFSAINNDTAESLDEDTETEDLEII